MCDCKCREFEGLGAADKKKHEKNTDDKQDSITIVCSGTAAGSEAPRIFLAKGKKIEHNTVCIFISCIDALKVRGP